MRTLLKPSEVNFKDVIETGDMVRLKSGGPTMRADWVGKETGTVTAFCRWFDGETIRESKSAVASLVKVEDEQL